MRLTWHIVAKDLRRHGWALGLLAVVIGAKIGNGVWALRSGLDGPEFGSIWEGGGMAWGVMLVGLETLLTYVLVAGFVHEDPLSGKGAEWQTRPISGGRLLGAKLLGLAAALGVMPVLIGLPWWLSCGYGWGEVGRAAAETISVQAVIGLVALPLAALTDGYGRFLLWTIVLLFSESIVSLIGSDLPGANSTAPEVWSARWSIIVGFAVVTALAVTSHHYLTRRRGRSVALLLAGLGAMLGVGCFWPWAWGQKPPDRAPAAQGITLEVGPARVLAQAGDKAAIETELRALGVPVGYQFLSRKVQQEFEWADGTKSAQAATIRAVGFDLDERRLLGFGPTAAVATDAQKSLITRAEIQPALIEKLRADPPAYRAEATLLLRQARREPDQRLFGPEARTFGANGRRVVNVTWEKEVLAVTILERRPTFLPENSGRVLGTIVLSTPNPASFWLLDRAGARASRATDMRSEALRASTVEIRRTVLRIDTKEPANAWLTAKENRDAATLAVVNYPEREQFTRIAVTGRVEVKP